jgi:hypothetical protein
MIDVEPGQGARAQLHVRLPAAPWLTRWLCADGSQFSKGLQGLSRCPSGLVVSERMADPENRPEVLIPHRSSPNSGPGPPPLSDSRWVLEAPDG